MVSEGVLGTPIYDRGSINLSLGTLGTRRLVEESQVRANLKNLENKKTLHKNEYGINC